MVDVVVREEFVCRSRISLVNHLIYETANDSLVSSDIDILLDIYLKQNISVYLSAPVATLSIS